MKNIFLGVAFTFISMFLTLNEAYSFILISDTFKLSKPNETVVNIAAGACRANGVSDVELKQAISDAINDYWNKVSESKLKLKLGSEVSRSISSTAESGEILVGCQSIGSVPGVTVNNDQNGSAKVYLNSTQFVPGGYLYGGLVGTLTHELGHAIGLHHSGDPASVMTYESHGWGPVARYLSQDDKDGIRYLYPNEGELGGLVGGCAALASQSSYQSSVSTFIYELIFLLLPVLIVVFFRRKSFRPNNF